MPPKKLKDLAEAPVYKMTHEEQVQLLSDALLREYMHRRGFRATLKAFDEEHPRDDNTISSRAVMSDLMALGPEDQQRLKADGIETIMEMLCNLRVERRVTTKALTEEAAAPLPKVPAKYDALQAKLSERAARQERKHQHEEQQGSHHGKRKKSKKTSLSLDDTAAGTEEDSHNRAHAKKKKSDAKGRPPRADAPSPGAGAGDGGMTIDDLLGSFHSSSRSGAGDDSDDDNSDPETNNNNNKRPQRRSSAAKAEDRGESVKAMPAAVPVRPAWMELEQKMSKQQHENDNGSTNEERSTDEDASEDGEDRSNSDDGDDADGQAEGGPRSGGGARLSDELRGELSAAFQLLCGFDGSLSRAFLEQGFTFDEELDCALIQWRPGACDAVVAPIQAFVAAYFYEREVYVKKEQRRQDCLLRALSTALEQAQPNASKIVLIDGPWKVKGGQTRFTRGDLRQQAGAARTRCWTQLSSLDEVREVLRETLLDESRWMKPRGSGVLSFVLSLLLSRGVDVVQKELMAGAATAGGAASERPSLLSASSSAADGHATVALANLVLAGRAVSYCHNGMQRGNQMGYPSKLKCGMLLGDTNAPGEGEGALSSSAYTSAMDPVMPSWVLRHNNHYANLYMTKDTRQVFQQKLNLGGSASEDVVYWDAATEDDLYTLTVTVRSITLGVSSGVRNAKSFVNTAITSVPVWSSAEVNWNGDAPLRD